MSRRDLVRQAQELGWTLERRTKHGWRFRRGDQTASLPGTPSDRRSLTNFKADSHASCTVAVPNSEDSPA